MLKKLVCLAVAAVLFASTFVSTTVFADESDEITQFMDCFLPTPNMSEPTMDAWGTEHTGKRDQYNGLEDMELEIRSAGDSECDYEYWDGGIIKDDETGKYYMFASRWDATKGSHYYWPNSEAIYAVSDNLFGPYIDQGLLWPDNRGGIGHNIFPFKLKEDDESGYKYGIIACESREGEIFVSKSLDGPWVYATSIQEQANEYLFDTYGYEEYGVDLYHDGSVKKRFNSKNTVIVVRPDGKYEAFTRDGDIALADNIMGPWEVVSPWTIAPEDENLWDNIAGMDSENIEDPVIWYAGGMYHCVVNKWDTKRAVYLTSDNGIDGWRLYQGNSYLPWGDFVKNEDGSVVNWDYIERPNVYIEDGVVRAMTFAVIDVAKWDDKENDLHASKIIVVNFDGEALEEFSKRDDVFFKREVVGIEAFEDANTQSWLDRSESGETDEWNENFGGRSAMYIQKVSNESLGAFSERANEGRTRKAEDAKIGYMKFDISDYDLDKIESAKLSVVFEAVISGGVGTNSLRVALAESDWIEGTGSSTPADDGSLTWDNQPKLLYDPDDLEGTTAVSQEFSTEKSRVEVTVDVTHLLKQVEPGTKVITLAMIPTKAPANLSFASRELNGCGPILSIEGGKLTSDEPEEELPKEDPADEDEVLSGTADEAQSKPCVLAFALGVAAGIAIGFGACALVFKKRNK